MRNMRIYIRANIPSQRSFQMISYDYLLVAQYFWIHCFVGTILITKILSTWKLFNFMNDEVINCVNLHKSQK